MPEKTCILVLAHTSDGWAIFVFRTWRYILEPRSTRLQFAQKLQLSDCMLSKTAEYALRAVACMGSQVDRPVSANLLAAQTKVPRRYLTRVLQDLCASGMVKSRPGPGGGYELTHATSKVTIQDLVESASPSASPIVPLCEGVLR